MGLIQSCPSCGTVFRHAEPRSGLRARCSCCSEVFPLATRPTYRVLATSPLRHDGVAVAAAAPAPVESPTDVLAREATQRVDSDLPPFAPLGSDEARRPVRGIGVAAADGSGRPAEPDTADSDSGPALWLAAAAAGTLAGLTVDAAVGGPLLAWPLGGALAGVVAAWGHRRWTLRRS